ncbi:DUF4190 domain-containing protein [Mycobacterium hodleri]|nr:DUF4190 domain-containing protein [Mycolicibacterium hodleri]
MVGVLVLSSSLVLEWSLVTFSTFEDPDECRPGDELWQIHARSSLTPTPTPENARLEPMTSPTTTARRTNRTAVASLASSVVTLFGIGSIVGIVLGVYALNHIAVTGERGRGLATAGILVGAVTLLLSMTAIVMGLSTL